MAEKIAFSAPQQAVAGATDYRVALVVFDWEKAVIKVHLREWNGTAFVGDKRIAVGYEGATATTLMAALNKANLSTAGNSLHQRIITRLLADGKIAAGTQSGEPD